MVNRRSLRYYFLLCILAAGLVLGAMPGVAPAANAGQDTETILEYDLVVVGSDPEGVAAALSGARNALNTLLVDTRPAVGGLMTRGWLNSIDMNVGPGNKILNDGIFLELYQRLGGDSFDVKYAQRVFNDMVHKQSGLDVMLDLEQIEPVLEKDQDQVTIRGVQVTTASGEVLEIRARAVIDATQDADLAAAAGVPYTFGHEDIGRPHDLMAVTLVFRLDGVSNLDWARIQRILNTDHSPLTGANVWSAWGFYEETRSYQPGHPNIGLRGLNIGRQMDGSVLINALHIFDVNPLDQDSRDRAMELGRNELPRLAQFIRENIPGLENSTLAGAAPELYIRESRHILAEYRLTIDDVLENRDFEDRIAFGCYPVDVQATKPGESGAVVGNPRKYAVPFRCLVPLQVDNLLVVGRSAGFDCLPHGSARTIPVGMATGQAAGAAAAQAIRENKTFRQMAYSPRMIQELQKRLTIQGMNLEPTFTPNPLQDHPDYEGLKFMRSLGIALGGYGNQYGLDNELSVSGFKHDLDLAIEQTGAAVKNRHPGFEPAEGGFTLGAAAQLLCRYLGEQLDQQAAIDYLAELDFWQPWLLEWIEAHNNVLNVGMGYTLIADFIKWHQPDQEPDRYVKYHQNG